MKPAAQRAVAACCAALVTLVAAAPATHAQSTTDTPTPGEIIRSLGPVSTPPHSGPLPDVMITRDLVRGTGPALAAGDTAVLQYVAADWSSGEELAAVDGAGAVQIPIDLGEVLPAWWQGMQGMRVGGRRTIASPPVLAYGARGQAGVVRPNQTIYFVVDLLDLTPQTPPGVPEDQGWGGQLIGRFSPFG